MGRRNRSGSDAALGFGALVVMVLCCAGPALVAAGALGAIGRLLAGPVAVVAALVLAAGAVWVAAARRRAGQDCCPPAGRDAGVSGRGLDRRPPRPRW